MTFQPLALTTIAVWVKGSRGRAHIGWKRKREHPRDTWRHAGWDQIPPSTHPWADVAPSGHLSPEAQLSLGWGLRKGRGKERRPHA